MLVALALVPVALNVINLAYAHPLGYTGIGSHYYFVGYETGFGGRKLIGTLFRWLLPAYATWSDLRPWIIGINLLVLALFVVAVGMIFNRQEGAAKRGGLLLLVLYMVGRSPWRALWRLCSG